MTTPRIPTTDLDQDTLSMINAEIAKMPIDAQHRIKDMASSLRDFITTNGGEGHMALALTGARIAAGQE